MLSRAALDLPNVARVIAMSPGPTRSPNSKTEEPQDVSAGLEKVVRHALLVEVSSKYETCDSFSSSVLSAVGRPGRSPSGWSVRERLSLDNMGGAQIFKSPQACSNHALE